MTSPKIFNSLKKKSQSQIRATLLFISSSIIFGHVVLPVLPVCKTTFYYWSRLRLCNSSFLSKHHFANHFKAGLFPHYSKHWFHLDIQNTISEVLRVWGSLLLAFTQQKLHHSNPLAISTQCETYVSVCVETLTCSYIESEVQSPIQQSTKTHCDFTSDRTITVSETCCPFLC